MKRIVTSLFLSGALLAASVAYAHTDAHRKKSNAAISKEQKSFGVEGEPRHVSRTIHVVMSDTMRFDPATVTINRGDTVRFIVRNEGKLMHEMVIGTMQELTAHAELMRKHPGMEHDEPHMAHVAPGKTEEIYWKFNRAGGFNFACLVAGHLEAGMVGKIIVK